ncbi:MAG: D-tyrosyl-tRNA(Tyr) deacylase, partial [Gammaproteobacteria bacterium]|nr:D-tyrosyl-tRNA(Tyr) deacylase [Gammaproteobacteria bacterium]
MLGLIQRVSDASVVINDQVHGEIGPGLLLLLGVQREDTLARAEKLLSKIVNYRVFNDEKGHMNLSLID